MKAIQIKILPPTNTKPMRLKAWTKAGTIVEDRHSEKDVIEQVVELAYRYAEEMGWLDHSKITGFGCLPNGDHVATLGDK